MSIFFRIDGKPVPKQSTRFAGFRAFTSKKVKDYAEHVRNSFMWKHLYWGFEDVMFNPVEVIITVFVSMKNLNKKQKEQAQCGLLKPTARPDVDNIAKGILDPLNGLVWKDDKQVFRLVIEKQYGESDYVNVEIREMK